MFTYNGTAAVRQLHPRLRERLDPVTSLMKAADSWEQFKMMLDRAKPRYGDTPSLPFED
jgi:hypothetical protein